MDALRPPRKLPCLRMQVCASLFSMDAGLCGNAAGAAAAIFTVGQSS
jgi:hypothetical protein